LIRKAQTAPFATLTLRLAGEWLVIDPGHARVSAFLSIKEGFSLELIS
jgi:hypothetical protein